jgi:hypothetical protein
LKSTLVIYLFEQKLQIYVQNHLFYPNSVVFSLVYISTVPSTVLLLPLLHFDPEQTRLGATRCFGIIAAFLIKGIAAFIKGVYLRLALFLFVGVLGQTRWPLD